MGILGSNRLSPEFGDDEVFFFRLNSLVKITHLKHFWCQQRATPRMTGLKAFPKNAISLDRGKREVAWEPKLLYRSIPGLRMPESGQHDPPPTVVNMEQANPLLGQ